MVEALRPTSMSNGAIPQEAEPKERIPMLIQGGMGAAISDWKLARAVAMVGEKLNEPVLGVVSGTGLPTIMTERLRRGDKDTKRALEEFDKKTGLEIGKEIIDKYYASSDSGLSGENPRKTFLPKPESLVTGKERARSKVTDLVVTSAFAEVWLAKQGHIGPIGINVLEKIQLLHLPTLLGAILADVDYVLVGAGIPAQIPKLLDDFANGQPASYKLSVEGLPEGRMMTLNPEPFISGKGNLKKPKFFPIVSSHILAKKLNEIDGVDGFIVEGPLAGGHNAPARGKQLNENGEPIYGDKDIPDLTVMAALGKPFYLAGGYASPEKLQEAKQKGAAGIQVGSVFALCEESGLRKDLKEELRRRIAAGNLVVRTSAFTSPSGFPFQVAQLDGTLSDATVANRRERACDLGYLVHAYLRPDGKVGFRCPAEPVDIYVRKRGEEKNTEGRVCICNALISTAGYAPEGEPPIVTLGKDLDPIRNIIVSKRDGRYTAEDVVRYLTS